eukprot:RCo037172
MPSPAILLRSGPRIAPASPARRSKTPSVNVRPSSPSPCNANCLSPAVDLTLLITEPSAAHTDPPAEAPCPSPPPLPPPSPFFSLPIFTISPFPPKPSFITPLCN